MNGIVAAVCQGLMIHPVIWPNNSNKEKSYKELTVGPVTG